MMIGRAEYDALIRERDEVRAQLVTATARIAVLEDAIDQALKFLMLDRLENPLTHEPTDE